MAEIHNGRCHPEKAPQDTPPLIQNGKIVIQYHHIGWMVCSAFTLVAVGVSFWLMSKHLQWYTNKYQQRYIIRILFMVPLYAVISTASYLWWNHSTPLILLRDCYEAIVLTAFFYLLLLYLSPDPNEQKEIFRKNGLSRENDRERRRRGDPIQKWMWPLGFIRWKPEDGLYFLQLQKWGVLQYCVIRPATTLAAVILDYAGLYCEESWGLGWGHIYIMLVITISVSIAMYCLLQLYMVVSEELKPQKPLLKLFAIKAVVFLTFWQATFLSVLSSLGIVKDTTYMTAGNINIGIGALAETSEMAIFALLHIKAFSYQPYRTIGALPTPRWRALLHAMNFKETAREVWAGTVYMFRKYRGREVDTQARREAALENVFGRSRFAITREANASGSKVNAPEKDLSVTMQVEKEVRVGEERQWLGTGDDYIYGLGYQAKRQRERSEGLESQIEKELARRGYSLRGPTSGGAYAPIVNDESAPPSSHQRAQASWWRRIYNRLSQSGPDTDVEGTSSSPSHAQRRSSSRRRSKDMTGRIGAAPLMPDVQEDDYDDPPPPSAIRTYRENRNKKKAKKQSVKRHSPPSLDGPLLFASFGDIPSPLSSPEARNDARMMIPGTHDRDHATLGIPSLTPPLPSPSAQSLQADSFLNRAFAASVEPGSSVEVLSAGPSSSQSHHNHVRLGSTPVVDTQVKAQPKTPVIVDPYAPSPSGYGPSQSPHPLVPMPVPAVPSIAPIMPAPKPPPAVPAIAHVYPSGLRETYVAPPATLHIPPQSPPFATPDVQPMWLEEESRGRRRSSHRRDSARFHPDPRNLSPPQQAGQILPPPQTLQQSPPQSPPHSPVRSPPRSPLRSLPQMPQLQRATAGYSRGTRRNSGTAQYTQHHAPQPTPLNGYTPTGDRIVLPAPLASVSGPSGVPAAAAQRTVSPLRYAPPSRERRWTSAQSPYCSPSR